MRAKYRKRNLQESKNVLIELDFGLALSLDGTYTPEVEAVLHPVDESTPGTPPTFTIVKIGLHTGTVDQLMRFVDQMVWGNKIQRSTLLEYLEERALESIRDNG